MHNSLDDMNAWQYEKEDAGDGMADFIIIERYEGEEGVYYNTRVCERTEEGYLPNHEWMS